jgi:uncharacterized protein (TIGR03435 family)
MNFSAFGTASWTVELVNHLWQSTVFAAGVWLLTFVLRRNQAHTRHRLWVLASAKFLLPLSLLISAGGWLEARMQTPVAQPAAISILMEGLTEPFAASANGAKPIAAIDASVASKTASAAATGHGWISLALVSVWGCGSLLLLANWIRRWWKLRGTVRSATPLMTVSGVPVLVTPMHMEPGVFGIVRPVLLLPQGITERLTNSQLDAILAHELCHVRRRDNLTALLHMVVEALFWFCPVVWWIREGLLEERERACDEAVLDSRREALVYAEGILNVCKFYVEAPMSCVSGVTGSDLKKRIVRIMEEQVTRKLDFGRKLLLFAAAMLVVVLPVGVGLVHAAAGQAAQKTGIDDTWQGTLHAPQKDLRIVVKITRTDAGVVQVTMFSIDQGGQGIPATKASFADGMLKYSIDMIDGSFEGKMSADGKSIDGTWTQGPNPLTLLLERATPDTAWTIPQPPPRMAPMAADANPNFEVATVKPSKPDQPGKMFRVNGDRFSTMNTTLNDLVMFAYGLQQKQIVGAPSWMDTEKFDIQGQPDLPGAPSKDQWTAMLKKLLADRFQLKFHKETRELPAYVLGVAKSGTKMTKSDADAGAGPRQFFQQLGVLNVQNASMSDFAKLMQSAVLDRPVVDQTGLPGKWNFLLKWTPDESQFGGMGMKVPPPSDAIDAPPPLFTAIQDQIGLKLDSGKAQVEVLVLDHVEQPSAN